MEGRELRLPVLSVVAITHFHKKFFYFYLFIFFGIFTLLTDSPANVSEKSELFVNPHRMV